MTQMTQPKKGKFNARRRKRYLEFLATGALRGTAAKAVGVGRSTPLRAMHNDPNFAAAVEDAEMQANSEVQRSLYQAAVSGNVTAMQVWLYNRMPDMWVNSQRREVHHQLSDRDRALFVQAASVAGLSGPQLEKMARVLEVGANADDGTQH